jgi:hypothetical protein
MEKTDRGELEVSVTSFSPFDGAFRRYLVLRGWGSSGGIIWTK